MGATYIKYHSQSAAEGQRVSEQEANNEQQRTFETQKNFEIDKEKLIAVNKKQKEAIINKKQMIFWLLVVGTICVAIIIMNAFVADIAYNNNKIIKQNSVLQSEIETLTIDIQSSRNISNIEKNAVKKIGMIQPEGDSFVDFSVNKSKVKNLASTMKKEVFN